MNTISPRNFKIMMLTNHFMVYYKGEWVGKFPIAKAGHGVSSYTLKQAYIKIAKKRAEDFTLNPESHPTFYKNVLEIESRENREQT